MCPILTHIWSRMVPEVFLKMIGRKQNVFGLWAQKWMFHMMGHKV